MPLTHERSEASVAVAEETPIGPEAFRDALRCFASGVTIVTIRSPVEPVAEVHGLTVSAFASLSPSPPLVAVMIDHRHRAHKLLDQEGAHFAVNMLGEDQQSLSDRFAWVSDEDRFAVGDWSRATTGAPVLLDALAWLDCAVHARCPAGTHTIYIGRVLDSHVSDPVRAPLVFWDRAYRKIADLGDA